LVFLDSCSKLLAKLQLKVKALRLVLFQVLDLEAYKLSLEVSENISHLEIGLKTSTIGVDED